MYVSLFWHNKKRVCVGSGDVEGGGVWTEMSGVIYGWTTVQGRDPAVCQNGRNVQAQKLRLLKINNMCVFA